MRDIICLPGVGMEVGAPVGTSEGMAVGPRDKTKYDDGEKVFKH